MKSKGFSLIEMLIVLVIFCMLISMLLPILSKALRKAREYEESFHSKRSEPILLVKNNNGRLMGLGFYRKEPIVYCKDEEEKNSHMMMYVFGFKKLQDHVQQNPQAFRDIEKLTEKECELLKECGFAEWEVWDSEEDWEKVKKQPVLVALG